MSYMGNLEVEYLEYDRTQPAREKLAPGLDWQQVDDLGLPECRMPRESDRDYVARHAYRYALHHGGGDWLEALDYAAHAVAHFDIVQTLNFDHADIYPEFLNSRYA